MTDFRTWTDEELDEAASLFRRTVWPIPGSCSTFTQAIRSEMERRAEIRIDRSMAAVYGPNPHGFTLSDVHGKHDASWYESRQTEEQWLAEAGAE